MQEYRIREIKSDELYLLEDFIYEAVFQKDDAEPLPRDIIQTPEIKVYIEDFGRPDDLCLVAEAVWTRILSGEVKGFGNIDEETPEFAISVYKEFRGKGLGTALMKSMLVLLKSKGYTRATLAVQKEHNYF